MPRPRSPTNRRIANVAFNAVPALFLDAGQKAWWRFVEFFTANIRNPNTREAYARAVVRFCRFCEKRQVALTGIKPFFVAAYIENLGATLARPSVKQHLAAIRMLFDYLVTGGVIPMNPAASVRGPKHVVKKGKTPVLSADEARTLLDSIETNTMAGLRDRVVIGVMLFSFARVGAVVALNVEDYYLQKKHRWFRLREKGGKIHDVPAHPEVARFIHAYLAAAGFVRPRDTPLFRRVDRSDRLTGIRMDRHDVLAMVKRRTSAAGLPSSICNHSFRATGITEYLRGGGSLEQAQAIASHESPETTRLYDRRRDELILAEIEKIDI